MIKRVAAMVLMLMALVACSMGGSSPTTAPQTQPTTQATKGAEATTAPQATEQPAAQATPDNSGGTGGGTGGGTSTGAIPMPPGSAEVKKGDNPITDILIDTMGTALQEASKSEGGTVTKVEYYQAPGSVADTLKFFQDEMPKAGWSPIDTGEQASPDTPVLSFVSKDMKNGTFIVLMDQSTMGGKGTLMIISTVTM